MKIGIFFSYWEKDWRGDYFKYVKKVKELGLEALELSAGELLNMSDSQVRELGAMARDLGVTLSCNIGPAKKYDIASPDPNIAAEGVRFECSIMDKMSILGSNILIGAMYSYWPYDFQDLDKPAVWARGVAGMKKLGAYAESNGIRLSMEVLNRFENLVMNTAEEAVAFTREVDSPAVGILLDTFHMNIEEDHLPDAICTAGKYLTHFHVGENNRKLPFDGPGSLNWRAIGAALREVSFDGLVIAEPFVTTGGQIAKDIKVWRDLSGGADEAGLDRAAVAYHSFLHSVFDR